MKIGQVSKKYNLTVTNIYFYIKKGILVPPQKNNQYIFDERTIADIEWLLELKKQRFSLEEIHRIISLRRVSNLSAKEDKEDIVRIFTKQIEFIKTQEQELGIARKNLEDKLMSWSTHIPNKSKCGVPLAALSYICCPHCQGDFELDKVMMDIKQIFSAKLSCACGYEVNIVDGIVETPYKNKSLYDKPDTERELYKDLPPNVISLFERSYLWLEEMLEKNKKGGHIWLEAYPTAWFFLHNHLHLLNKDDTLIVIDKFPETLKSYKHIIELQGVPCDILYIADASSTPPIKKGIVDVNVDFFATNEHHFYNKNFFLEQMRPYFNNNIELYGVYFHFMHGKNSINKLIEMYPESSSNTFNLKSFIRELKENYTLLDSFDCGSVDNSGENLGLGFHAPGEKLGLYAYYAKAHK